MSERSRSSRVLRAIIYARVSKDDSRKARSCGEQIEACTNDCEYEGWPIAEVLQDNDRGASRHSKRVRVEFNRLPSILRRGDVLVVWEPSRITRNMKEFGIFCDLCAERGVLLYYDGRIWDLNDDDDRNRVWQDILDGAKQAGKTRKRVMRTMSANRRARLPHGKAAPGYEIVYENGESVGRRVIPAQQLVLRKAAERLLSGDPLQTTRRVSRDLEEEWREAGGTGSFEGRDLVRFLTNPTLYGLYHHDGEILGEGKWEPILDPKLYRELRDKLTDPDRITNQGSAEPRWLLSSIARCGVCIAMGNRGKVDRKKPAGARHTTDSYVCAEFNHFARNRQRVDDHVEALLLTALERPDALARLTAAHTDDTTSMDDDLAEIEVLTKERDKYVRDAARTRMSADAVAVWVEAREAEIRAIRDRINERTAMVDPLLLELVGPGAWDRWEGLHISQQRYIIRKHMEITIHRVGPGRPGKNSDIGVEVRPLGVLALAG